MEFSQFFAETEFRFEGKTVGIITAYNPNGKKSPLSLNRQKNKELWNELRADGYDPWAIRGNYQDKTEQSFLVPNIGKEKIVKYGKKYKQKAVVWAKKMDKGYSVEWIEGGETKKKKHIKNIRSLISQSTAF